MNGPQVMKPAALVLLVALLCAET
uniref:Uncharacterized protein n=3 Tax=Cavia porcellus TaxID=10141 RepID=A0A286XCW1_CAVPO